MHEKQNDLEELFWGQKAPREKYQQRSVSESIPWSLMMLVMIFFALSGLSGFATAKYFHAKTPQELDLSNSQPAFATSKESFTILILGTDERKDETQARSDTIMLAFVDTKFQKISILSLPRDTYINIPGVRNKTKLNHAHAIGGTKLTADTLQDYLGVNIDYYIETNFAGFAKVIDALGGIDILVEKHMYYRPEGIDLQEGLQHLDGDKALQYVRFRSDGQGDVGRIERQQKFLHAVTDKLLTPQTIIKLPKIVEAVSQAIKTDMEYPTLLSLAGIAKNLNSKSVSTNMLPGTAEYIGGVSYWKANQEETTQMLEEMKVNSVPESERSNKWK